MRLGSSGSGELISCYCDQHHPGCKRNNGFCNVTLPTENCYIVINARNSSSFGQRGCVEVHRCFLEKRLSCCDSNLCNTDPTNETADAKYFWQNRIGENPVYSGYVSVIALTTAVFVAFAIFALVFGLLLKFKLGQVLKTQTSGYHNVALTSCRTSEVKSVELAPTQLKLACELLVSQNNQQDVNCRPTVNEVEILFEIDIIDAEKCPLGKGYWLITEYMPLGSLFNYLLRHEILSPRVCLAICINIASGLDFLHKKIYSKMNGVEKPRIAHRDVKTTNILLKTGSRAGICALICDFGNAVAETSSTAQYDRLVGTCRYMAPEILDDTSWGSSGFNALLQADVYALSLTLYEVCQRTKLEGYETPPYEPPFMSSADDMSYSYMIKLHEASVRPVFRQCLLIHQVMKRIIAIVQECWARTPSSRLTSFIVLTKLQELQRSFAPNLAARTPARAFALSRKLPLPLRKKSNTTV